MQRSSQGKRNVPSERGKEPSSSKWSKLEQVSASSAVLDDQGEILFVNSAWRHFALTHGASCDTGEIGENYIDVCRRAVGAARTTALAMANAIEDVARGWRYECHLEYASDTPRGPLWFVAHVSRWCGPGPARVIVTHEDVTARRRPTPVSSASLYHACETEVRCRRGTMAIESLLAPIDDRHPEGPELEASIQRRVP